MSKQSVLISVAVFLAALEVNANAQPFWAVRSTDGPSPRRETSMVYDSCRGVTVLFGGTDFSNKLGDTWEWDGNAWILRATTGPSPRVMNSMAFDEIRRVVVLFGGVNQADTYLNDTWVWDGTSWTQKHPSSSPPTRNGAGMTYDSTSGVVLLFGGWQPLLNDTWKWDGATWGQVSTTGPVPSPRSDFAMSYDPTRDRTVVFGGSLQPVLCGTRDNETWELDISTNPATWTEGPTAPPQLSPRSGMQMVYDSLRSVMVLFGGTEYCATGSNFGDTWEYDGSTNTWSLIATPTAPSARHGYALGFDSIREEVLLFGGANSPEAPQEPIDLLGDTWSYGNRSGIPTVSTWGMLALVLCVLVAGTVVFRRKAAPAQS